MSEDTVFALSSPVGGAIAIVRITGSGAYAALGRVFRCKNAPEHRVMNYGHVIDPESGETIDSAMACFLKAPATYTGEDMAEIYIHGSRVIAKRTLSVLSRFLRPAEGGEFTKRAFMNGKLDLSQAEAVMDVISSVTEQGARMAEEQLEGSIGSGIKDIEDRLIDILSGVEAALDYPDELEEDTVSALGSELAPIIDKLDYLIRGGNAARIFREGASVAILGAPNAGKSSLFNALMGTERAIVTSIPGTTRDTLEETLDICGAPVRITDTAGIREGADEAERIGVERARKAGERADLILIAIDGTKPIDEESRALINAAKRGEYRKCLILFTKADKHGFTMDKNCAELAPIAVSSVTGEGIEELKERMAALLLTKEAESALVTNSRHIYALAEAKAALETADAAMGTDLAAADIRTALYALGQITGREVTSDVIERIFSRFCVGK